MKNSRRPSNIMLASTHLVAWFHPRVGFRSPGTRHARADVEQAREGFAESSGEIEIRTLDDLDQRGAQGEEEET